MIAFILFYYIFQKPLHEEYMKSLDTIKEDNELLIKAKTDFYKLYREYMSYKKYYENHKSIKTI